MNWLKDLLAFIRAVAGDERIPSRDKKVILAMVALIVSPVDFIPDWIPIFGVLDDLLLLALVLDYFFNVLDAEILLSHYPWGMKSFSRLRSTARVVALLTPDLIKRRIWKYQPSPYRK